MVDIPDPDERGGAAYGRLTSTARLLYDSMRLASGLPADVMENLSDELDAVIAVLDKYQESEENQWAARRPDLGGLGNLLQPPYFVDVETETGCEGRITFTRAYLGGGGAAHGGTPALFFDDVLGRSISRFRGGQRARTAYLKVDYRKVTPIDVELSFDINLNRVEGRKNFVSGRIWDAEGTVLCEAEGLFIMLLPHQP